MWKGNFDKAVDILKPLRYDVVTIGGSNAQVCEFYCKFTHMSAKFLWDLVLLLSFYLQRDIFSLFLIYAALHSSRKEHHYLAR